MINSWNRHHKSSENSPSSDVIKVVFSHPVGLTVQYDVRKELKKSVVGIPARRPYLIWNPQHVRSIHGFYFNM